MDQRRFLSWVLLSFAILMFSQMLFPPPPPPEEPDVARQIAAKDQDAPAGQIVDQGPKPLAPTGQDKQSATGVAAEAVAGEMAKAIEVPLEFYTLGSVDPESGYRMLITLTNQGAAVERIELSSPRYRDLDFQGGYLGHIAPRQFFGSRPTRCRFR